MKRYKNLIYLALITFLTIGGCDVDFGDDNETGSSNSTSQVRGDITSVFDSDEVSGIRVVIQNSNDITESDGTFNVEGSISGNNKEIQFQDTNDGNSIIGRLRLNIWPGAELNLGKIEVDENQLINVLDDISIDFSGTVINNSCEGDTGSITVQIDNKSDIEVLVQIDSSTDLERNNEDIECDEIKEDQQLDIEGTCRGTNCSNVNAGRIDF